MTCFKSETTLCIPNPVFNHTTNHTFIVNRAMPMQKILLQCFGNSTASNGIVFELWKRHYYPNVRDQLIGKVIKITFYFAVIVQICIVP